MAITSTAGVLESIAVRSRNVGGRTCYEVTWTGTDGMMALHAAFPKEVAETPIPDQVVILSEITDLPGFHSAKRLGFVFVSLDRHGTPEARLHLSGKNFPLNILNISDEGVLS